MGFGVMSNKLVSIILPVYNAEDSLHDCINSILSQTYSALEIIIINDGSTDQSGEICETYAKIDPRIKIIHQKNSGPSHARNRGIYIACGAYIQFVDADDSIKPQMTKTLVQAMTDHIQLVICGYESVKGPAITKKYIPSIQGIYKQVDFIKHFGELYKETLIPSPCNKLYDAQLLQQEQLSFNEKVSYGEDLLFNLYYIEKSHQIHVIRDLLYNYSAIGDTSLSRKFKENLAAQQQQLYNQVKLFLIQHNNYEGRNLHYMKVIYANQKMQALNNLFHKNSPYTFKQKKRFIQTITADQQLMNNIDFFQEGIQTRFIGKMIQYKFYNGIYAFFACKRLLKVYLQPVKHLLKRAFQSHDRK